MFLVPRIPARRRDRSPPTGRSCHRPAVPSRPSISARIASLHGSAPQIARRRLAPRGSTPCRSKLVGDHEQIGRCGADDVGLEIADELHLPLRHSAAHRDHRCAEPLRAVVEAEPAGEQPVAVGDMDLVAPAARPLRGSSAPSGPTRCRCPPGYSRPRSACPSCRSRHGCGRSSPSARRTCRTDNSPAGRPWS